MQLKEHLAEIIPLSHGQAWLGESVHINEANIHTLIISHDLTKKIGNVEVSKTVYDYFKKKNKKFDPLAEEDEINESFAEELQQELKNRGLNVKVDYNLLSNPMPGGHSSFFIKELKTFTDAEIKKAVAKLKPSDFE
ncbi:hypothetical protein HUU53_04770 [Candidatus Micrarchaeota archaeon]|nr:hypothetical protein [Candidatus Micrarchaeota archaeon]